MQCYLAILVLSIACVSVDMQGNTSVPVPVVVEAATVVVVAAAVEQTSTVTAQTTIVPVVVVHEVAAEATTAATTTTTIAAIASLNVSTTTIVSNKAFLSEYVEPPPHPLGYCIRGRLRCSKIRRCCKGPCDVSRMKCPE